MGFPHGHRKTTTLVAGLRMNGMVAPLVLDGPINGDWFEAYVAQVLVPELRPGDVVIMDNLSSHKRDCLIPGFDGALFSQQWKEALWARYSTGAPQRLRQCVERYSIVKRA